MKNTIIILFLFLLGTGVVSAAGTGSASISSSGLIVLSGSEPLADYTLDVSSLSLSDAAVHKLASYQDNSFELAYINSHSLKLILHLDYTKKTSLRKAWKLKDWNDEFARKQAAFADFIHSLV